MVSGWQDVNIGDIAHTPGLVGLIKQYLPKARIILWKRSKSQMVEDMLHNYYPSLQIIIGKVDEQLMPTSDEVKAAFCDAGFSSRIRSLSSRCQFSPVLAEADGKTVWYFWCNHSFKCHSPIIAAANGTPAFYLRQPEDTIKGQIYYDLGLGDWTFEINNTTGQQIASRLMQVVEHYKAAENNVQSSLKKVALQYDTAFRLMQEKFPKPSANYLMLPE